MINIDWKVRGLQNANEKEFKVCKKNCFFFEKLKGYHEESSLRIDFFNRNFQQKKIGNNYLVSDYYRYIVCITCYILG